MTLITLHNTKGLEFDRVIITGVEEGIFPHESSSHAPAEVEEERRLFYVGITRARESPAPDLVQAQAPLRPVDREAPSRFLDEVPEESCRRVGMEAPGDGADDGCPLGSEVFHDEYGPGVVQRAWTSEREPRGPGALPVRAGSRSFCRSTRGWKRSAPRTEAGFGEGLGLPSACAM